MTLYQASRNGVHGRLLHQTHVPSHPDTDQYHQTVQLGKDQSPHEWYKLW